MKRSLLIISFLLLVTSGVFAQSKEPVFGMFLKSSRAKVKDKTTGEFGEWKKIDIKNWVIGVYTQYQNGKNEILIVDWKEHKPQKSFKYANLETGADAEGQFLKATGVTDMIDKPLTVMFYYQKEAKSMQTSNWIRIQFIYDNTVREYDASYTK